jgi:hypothetical protein
MAENNNEDNNIDNNNDNENENENENENNNERGFIGGVLEYFTTPTRNRIDRQHLIDQQLQQHRNQRQAFNLEEELGISAGVAALFPNNSDSEEDEEEKASEEETNQEDDCEFLEVPAIMPTTYTLGGMSMAFDTDEPTPNADYEVGVVLSKEHRPALGSDAERKLLEGICKNQYDKYNRAESSMKSIERLLQSRGIMDTITATTAVLDRYDMKQPFTIIFPMDPTLQKISLKMTFDGSAPRTVDLLVDFRKVTKEEVALSCSWWNLHGFFMDGENHKQSLSRDMNWSYLHFKNHVNDNLYNDVNKAFLKYNKKQRGGPLFFKLLVDILLTSNETSLSSLESTIKKFNIAKDGLDDIPETIKILEAGSLTILAMRDDGSERSPLPEKYVVDLFKVFQTTSVQLFNDKMAALHSNLDLYRLTRKEKTLNTIANLESIFETALDYYTELFNEGVWTQATLESAKSTFNIFWKNRCWNCKKENCTVSRCDLPIDNSQIEINKQEWMKANNKDSTSMGRRRGGGPKKTPEAWRDPEPHENNKRIIYGKPYTWNGRSSWILDKTPDSGLPETPLGTNKLADVPSTIQPPTDKGTVGDDGTVMPNNTGWTLENRNEIRRIQANLQNLGANLAAVLKQE